MLNFRLSLSRECEGCASGEETRSVLPYVYYIATVLAIYLAERDLRADNLSSSADSIVSSVESKPRGEGGGVGLRT